MHSIAVTNGEHMEAFTAAKKNGASQYAELDSTTGSESESTIVTESETPSELGGSIDELPESFNGKEKQKHVYNKPCPKSKKVNEGITSTEVPGQDNQNAEDNETELSTKNQGIQEPSGDVVKDSPEPSPVPIQVIPEETEVGDIPEKPAKVEVHEELEQNGDEEAANIEIREESEDNDDIADQAGDASESVEIKLDDEWNCWDDEEAKPSQCDIRESSAEPGSTTAENGTSEREPIVTEPEDELILSLSDDEEHSEDEGHSDELDQPSNISETEFKENDVIITFLDSERAKAVQSGSEHSDVPEEMLKTTDPLIEFPRDSPEPSRKVLHHRDNPMENLNSQTVAPEFKRVYGTHVESSIEDVWDPNYSFAKSLRSLSGRRGMRPIADYCMQDQKTEQTIIDSSSKTSHSSMFAFNFGKRKAEEIPKENETKRIKAEEGVDSLGFFARLTSPVINRLKQITVRSPNTDTPQAGKEVTGHEEMAVALIAAPPATKRCVIM